MKKILIHLLSAGLIATPFLLFAQSSEIGLKNPLRGVDSISDLILIVTRVARYIAIPFIILAVMYSGWLYLWEVARGGKNFQKAHNAIYYTVIGAFILLSAELIALVLRNTINSLT